MSFDCSQIPEERAKDALEKSKKTGKEVGFTGCERRIGSGWKESRTRVGSEDDLTVWRPHLGLNCEKADVEGASMWSTKSYIFHTHPPKHPSNLSSGDVKQVYTKEHQAVCMTDFDGNVECFVRDDSDEGSTYETITCEFDL